MESKLDVKEYMVKDGVGAMTEGATLVFTWGRPKPIPPHTRPLSIWKSKQMNKISTEIVQWMAGWVHSKPQQFPACRQSWWVRSAIVENLM